ncbi:WD40 repeat [Paramuricea clavata]|uniref:WD40 repeat n=1 Tax=Paramuricea clavata TaxID=317549 RepID=A0A7D9EUH9_PARCT|nr:WD40 repeat [Paramuricea clavata]
MAELAVVRVSLQLAWSLLSNRLIKRLNTGVPSDEALRKLLLDKFQRLHEELNSLRRKELVAAVSFMENGYELFLKDPVEAKKEFTKARDAAQMAFGVVAETSDKLLATKILLASAMHEFDDKIDTAISLSLKYVSRLNSLPEIVDTCGTYLRKGVGSRFGAIGSGKKLELLKGLSEINRNVWEFVKRNDPEFDETKWPSVRCADRLLQPVFELLPLRDCQELTRDDSGLGTPVAMAVCGKKLFVSRSSPNNQSLDNANSVEVIDLDAEKVTMLAGHSAVILALVAVGDRVFSGSYDRSVLVWDALTLSLVQKLGEHDGAVRSMVTNTTMLFTAGSDKVIKCWDLATLGCVITLSGHMFPISLLTFQHHLFSYAPGEGIRVWNVKTWNVISTIPDLGNVTSIQCSIQSKLFVHCGSDVKVFNLGSSKEEATLKNVGKVSLRFPRRKIIGFSGDNMYVHDLQTSKCLLNQALKFEKSIEVSLMHFSYDLGMLFLGGTVKDSREGIVVCL